MIVTGNYFPSLAAAVTSCSWTIDVLIVFAVGEVIKMEKKKKKIWIEHITRGMEC